MKLCSLRPADNPWLTTQARPAFDHRPDRSGSLSCILDPRRINDHVVSWEPNVGISKIVIDPIAVVVDVGLCELHAGKRYARGRLSYLLTRLDFLHLHSSGGIGGGNFPLVMRPYTMRVSSAAGVVFLTFFLFLSR